MKINVTGTSNYKQPFVEIINSFGESRDFTSEEVFLNSTQEYDCDVLLLLFDGLPIDFVINLEIHNSGVVIPIFIDSNNVYICGNFKKDYFDDEICSCCMMKRLKDNLGLSPMFNCIFSQTSFLQIECLTEHRVTNLLNGLLRYLLEEPNKLSKFLITYSLDIECFRLTEISGYTGCSNCDKNTYGIEKIIAEIGE